VQRCWPWRRFGGRGPCEARRTTVEHVVDGETLILSLDRPSVAEGRFASLRVGNACPAESLAQGFEALWQEALKDLREIRFYPGARRPGD
jgi:hypothetical protein